MTAKNALLFFLAVFGILFVGLDAYLPAMGITGLTGAMAAIGGAMLIVFLLLVLGVGFVLRMAYIVVTIALVGFAAAALLAGDWVMGAIYAAVSFVLLALIPKVFLSKK